MMEKNKRVLLGMSGGTDSSVAAMLLQEAGYEVTGVTFRFYELNGSTEYLDDARALAARLGMEHITYDARSVFRRRIIDYFIDEYMAGHTPVPCTLCNNCLKWPLLAKIADEKGIYHLATGHYVRKTFLDGKYYITPAADSDKDQSFFLWGLPQDIMKRMLLPMGEMTKPRARALAAARGFAKVSAKKDSIGVCFCPLDYRSFLKREFGDVSGDVGDVGGDVISGIGDVVFSEQQLSAGIPLLGKEGCPTGGVVDESTNHSNSSNCSHQPPPPSGTPPFQGGESLQHVTPCGPPQPVQRVSSCDPLQSVHHAVPFAFSKGQFLDENGTFLGWHEGYPFYTIGQRRGLGIHLNRAVFVKEIHPETNVVVLAPLQSLEKNAMWLKDWNIVDEARLLGHDDIIVKIRYRKQANRCTVTVTSEGLLYVKLHEPLTSVAVGQAAAFYKDGLVLGGGIIAGSE